MPGDPATVVIGFRGRAQLVAEWNSEQDVQVAGQRSRVGRRRDESAQSAEGSLLEAAPPTEEESSQAAQRLVHILNRQASKMARDTEAEIRGIVPPGIAVQVRLTVGAGSLTVAGVVTFLASWAVQALSSDAFQQLAEKAVVFAVERVTQSFVQEHAVQPTRQGNLVRLAMNGGMVVQREYTFADTVASAPPSPRAPSFSPLSIGAWLQRYVPLAVGLIQTILLLLILYVLVSQPLGRGPVTAPLPPIAVSSPAP